MAALAVLLALALLVGRKKGTVNNRDLEEGGSYSHSRVSNLTSNICKTCSTRISLEQKAVYFIVGISLVLPSCQHFSRTRG